MGTDSAHMTAGPVRDPETGAICFLPDRVSPVVRGGVLAVAGGLLFAGAVRNLPEGGMVTDLPPGLLTVALGGLGLAFRGVVLLLGGACGYPRLILGAAGLTWQGLLLRRQVAWACLSPFVLAGQRRAIARILPPERDLFRRRFVLRPVFRAPLGAVVEAVNARLAFAPGWAPGDAAEPVTTRVPWLSIGLVLLLGAVFVAERQWPVAASGEFGTRTLLTLGAMNPGRVQAGEWYRLLTATVLHVSPEHLLFNSLALLIAGWQMEAVLGRAWFLTALFAGGLGGSVFDLAVNPPNVTSAGASGAIMGLFAAGFMAAFRLPAGTQARWGLQLRSLQILVPTLLPWLFGPAGSPVDHAGHAGGVLGGALIGVWLWKHWPAADWRAPHSRLAAALAGIGGAAWLAAMAMAASHALGRGAVF